jgi:cyanophycinase
MIIKAKVSGICILMMVISLASCTTGRKPGKLFIIGGGQATADMIDKMITESHINKVGYGIILPMSSEEPDTAIKEWTTLFNERGQRNVIGLNIKKGETLTQARIDTIRNANLIFMSGGDQCRFMSVISGTPIKKAIHEVFDRGGVIGGYSAGAALMSETMITGNELKYPDNQVVFNNMEAGDVETAEGVGMLRSVIIDQHFIKRKRLNRLIAASVEHPALQCVGIDESTAIFVDGNKATVFGLSQVIVLHNPSSEVKSDKGLLFARNMSLDIYLPGENFRIGD